MNLSNPFLIKFPMILFSLKGSVSMNDKIHRHIGNHITLQGPGYGVKAYILTWTKDYTYIATITDNNITMAKKQLGPNKYHLGLNGNLEINELKKVDAGNYTVKAYNKSGMKLFERSFTLQVDDLSELSPKLNELCSQKILTCEMKSSEEQKPRFKLFQDTKEIETFEQPVYDNTMWKVTLPLKVLSGKYRCEVDVNSEKNHIEKQITCLEEDLPDSVSMLFILMIIMGSVVTLIIFLALIIYCIRRKKAKRCEREAEEYALQMQIENHIQQRKLPEIPVSSGFSPAAQKNSPSSSHLQQQIAPSKSCPHPKPPRRIKERS
ncbi:T-cell surface antigen CD2 [Erythrolamprus reginae]|uniref:T-cell surface antigen CD2 n=1 Tax=Erythrolamprus reginae TaxID=121349 RepID=UPI00396CC36A